MNSSTICVVGLGYVGLPLAHAFATKNYQVIGYDVNEKRITELQGGTDHTNELTDEQLQAVQIEFSTDPTVMSKAKYIIVALPTPIDEENNPDLRILESASKVIGENLQKGAIVVYESTVYPGVTEEICGSILQKASGLTCGKDFYLGYSPERINPGDKVHTVKDIVKIVAGQTEAITDELVELYGSVVEAGIHRAPNIKVAEMGKAIENAQRDLNIAFVNEVAILCNAIGIDTNEVLAAAGTKWNFLPFKPGLVGGHCIGVDPYYLVEKAKHLKVDTHVITAGRQVNDNMAHFVAHQVMHELDKVIGAEVLVLGLTFKENVPDTRNSKSVDVVKHLEEAYVNVEVHDPFFDAEALADMGFTPGSLKKQYDAVLLLVPHAEYLDDVTTVKNTVKQKGMFYDLKGLLKQEDWSHYTYKAL